MRWRDTSKDGKIVARIRRAGTVGVTRQEIAKSVGIKERTLYDYLRALIASGEIVMRIDREIDKRGHQRIARYVVANPHERADADKWTPAPWVNPIRRAFLENPKIA